jgi:hypothetical protein
MAEIKTEEDVFKILDEENNTIITGVNGEGEEE